MKQQVKPYLSVSQQEAVIVMIEQYCQCFTVFFVFGRKKHNVFFFKSMAKILNTSFDLATCTSLKIPIEESYFKWFDILYL